ncbi:MAG: L,D-transpeptidase family protein [Ginsengibacter sp.]
MKAVKYLALILFLFGCNTAQKDANQAPAETKNDTGRVVVHTDTVYLTRNESITPANSYSDLFLDSASLENFIQHQKLSTSDGQAIHSFYNYRNMQFAWFSSQGFTEELKGFWNLQDKFGKTARPLRNKMDTLLNKDTVFISRYDTAIINTELLLTNEWLQLYRNNYDKLRFSDIGPEKVIPIRKSLAVSVADTILNQRFDSTTGAFTNSYFLLIQKLRLLDSIAKQGGWRGLILTSKQIKKGAASPFILQLKKRMNQTGEYGNADTSKLFNDSLELAVKSYQKRYGMKPSGIITDTLVRSLNVPVIQRLQQVILNLKRLQWMPITHDQNYISVNIPEFMLSVFENNAKAFEMPVAVGKEGTNTTMFSGNLDQVVFSPYWNIPSSIVQREILPAIKADKDYLKKHNMEIVGKNDSIPAIRQLPGKDNGLGKVKFLFPNRYDIYFHDTYAKDIFKKDKRAASHGCIRLADAEKMANYLLHNNPEWTPGKINAAMNNNKEQSVKVNPPVPVNITYFTAWVDENGQLNMRDDVYGHDKKTGLMMFGNTGEAGLPILTDTIPAKK